MNKEEAIDLFLEKVFDKALSSDLNQMLSITKGLDFAIIVLVCSGVELLGALNQGNLSNPTKRFNKALELFFPDFDYKKCKKFFYNLFRCGVAHQAFIKPGTATARNPDYEDYHLKRIFIEGEKEAVLFIHPDIFAKHFFQALDEFKRSLKGNSKAIDNAYSAIQAIYKYYPKPDPSIEIYTSITYSKSDGTTSVSKMPLPACISASNFSLF